MHVLNMIVVFLALTFLLILGVLSVLQDLLVGAFCEAPAIIDENLTMSDRRRGDADE